MFSTCAVGGADRGTGEVTSLGFRICVFTLGRTSPGDDVRLGGRGNSDKGSLLLLPLLRSTASIEVDIERTGAMIAVETERGGTIRDAATERGDAMFIGREPGFDSVRVRCRVAVCALLTPAIFALADATGGRDSVTEVERVTDGWAPMPAVCGRRNGRGTAVREGVVWELVTDCGALLESREPDETIELADAFDCVRLRVGRAASTDVTLSVSAALRRY